MAAGSFDNAFVNHTHINLNNLKTSIPFVNVNVNVNVNVFVENQTNSTDINGSALTGGVEKDGEVSFFFILILLLSLAVLIFI